jgi:hypothetical protein
MSVCKSAPLGVALIAVCLHWVAAQDLTSKSIFEGATTTRTTLGADAKEAVAGAPEGERARCSRYPCKGFTWPICSAEKSWRLLMERPHAIPRATTGR